uniref:Uncharacterized protein n=1 Tax=Candidatus Kentrum sp. LPFa TaxID=2126335 RepID=A0A450W7A9_9GAMM|nr:MAG: hypothetical protein BECKLPF1236B_GA0070989_104018 [Candidatus Kentron sp. LPFa]
MTDKATNTAQQTSSTVIIVDKRGNAAGIASFIFGLLSIFFLAPLFVPLALLLGVIGVIKKQLIWSVLGIVCGIIGFVTSPILLGLFGLAAISANL